MTDSKWLIACDNLINLSEIWNLWVFGVVNYKSEFKFSIGMTLSTIINDNKIRNFSLALLIREHRQLPPPILLIFWICCSLSKNKRHVFFCGKNYLGVKTALKNHPENSFLKISSIVIEIFWKFKMAFVCHKRQMTIVIYIHTYIKGIINQHPLNRRQAEGFLSDKLQTKNLIPQLNVLFVFIYFKKWIKLTNKQADDHSQHSALNLSNCFWSDFWGWFEDSPLSYFSINYNILKNQQNRRRKVVYVPLSDLMT